MKRSSIKNLTFLINASNQHNCRCFVLGWNTLRVFFKTLITNHLTQKYRNLILKKIKI